MPGVFTELHHLLLAEVVDFWSRDDCSHREKKGRVRGRIRESAKAIIACPLDELPERREPHEHFDHNDEIRGEVIGFSAKKIKLPPEKTKIVGSSKHKRNPRGTGTLSGMVKAMILHPMRFALS